MARISVHLLALNSARTLGEALDALRAQTFSDFTLTVVDNASTDESVAIVRARFPDATVLRNFKNLGFGRAHNQAIELARSRWTRDDKLGRSAVDRYVLILAPDVLLAPDALEKLVAAADGRPKIAAVAATILQVFHRLEETEEPRFSDVVDSAGLAMSRGRHALGRRAGERSAPAGSVEEVFGVPGALGLFRVEALEDAGEGAGAFDEVFFASLEDADLAWRLRWLGWSAVCAPGAVAHRYRVASETSRARVRSAFASGLSLRNRLLLLVKNESLLNALLHLPWIAAAGIAEFFGTIFRTPTALRAYGQALWLLPGMFRRRRRTIRRRKVSAKELRGWFR